MSSDVSQTKDASNPKWLQWLSLSIDLLFFGSGIWLIANAESTGEKALAWFITISFFIQISILAYASGSAKKKTR